MADVRVNPSPQREEIADRLEPRRSATGAGLSEECASAGVLEYDLHLWVADHRRGQPTG